METYTVLIVYHSNAVIIKRLVPQDAVDRMVTLQERTNKFKKLILTPTKK